MNPTISFYPERPENSQILFGVGLTNTVKTDPFEIFRLTCKVATSMVGVTHSAIVLFDANYTKGIIVAEYPPALDMVQQSFSVKDVPIETQLIEGKQPIYIPDVAKADYLGEAQERLLKANVCSMLIVPLIYHGRVIGSLGLDSCDVIRNFTENDKTLVQLLVEQCAAAAGLMRQQQRLEQLQLAKNAVTSAQTLDDSLNLIIQSAFKAFDGDYAFIWPYNPQMGVFVQGKLIGVNLPDRLQADMPISTNMISKLLEMGAWEESGLKKDALAQFSTRTQIYMRELGIRAFQSIALKAGNEAYGVMAVVYKTPRAFESEDREMLTEFAHHTAWALQGAYLHDKSRRKNDEAKIIGAITVTGDLQSTLQYLVESMKRVIQSDIVTIYAYEQDRGIFTHTAGSGLGKISHLCPPDVASQSSKSLRHFINFEQPYYASEAPFNDIWLKGEFTNVENLHASLVIPIRYEGRNIGVMFVNYRNLHTFTTEEINDALNYVNLAAPSIRNMQLKEEKNRVEAGHLQIKQEYTARLERLRKASQGIAEIVASGEKDLNKLLKLIAKLAQDAFRCDIITIYVTDGKKVKITVSHGNDLQDNEILPNKIKQDTDKTIWRLLNLPVGQLCEQGVHPDDLLLTSSFAKKHLIRSSVGLPLRNRDEALGVMFINYQTQRFYAKEDIEDIVQFANQVASAVRNTIDFNKIQALHRSIEQINNINTNESPTIALKRVVEVAQTAFKGDSAVLYTFDADKRRFADAYQIGCKNALNVRHPQFINNKTNEKRTVPWKISDLDREEVACCSKGAATHEVFKGKFTDDESIEAVIAMSLYFKDKLVGVLFINYGAEYEFSSDDRKAFADFANQVAKVIDRAQQQQMKEIGAQIAKGFLEIRNEKMEGNRFQATLDMIAQLALQITGLPTNAAESFSHITRLTNNRLSFVSASDADVLKRLKEVLGDIDLDRTDRPIGIVGRAAKENRVILVENAPEHKDWLQFENHISVIALPIEADKQVFGVLTVGHREANKISVGQQQALEILVKDAAPVIQKAIEHDRSYRRRKKKDEIWMAAREVKKDSDIRKLFPKIVSDVVADFGADAGMIYPYDESSKCILWGDLEVIGVDKVDFQKNNPRLGEINQRAVAEGYVEISDLSHSSISPIVQDFFARYDMNAACCVSLHTEAKCYGTILLLHRQIHTLNEKDVIIFKEIAEETAKILQLARSQAQVHRLQCLSKLTNSDSTKSSDGIIQNILDTVKQASDCDLATLHWFDSVIKTSDQPQRFARYKHSGIYFKEPESYHVHLPTSLLWGIVNSPEKYHAIENSPDAPLLKGQFVENEKIVSTVVIKLYVQGDIVGVMFLNYRHAQCFYYEEIEDYLQFAHQAALTISNAQRFDEQKQSIEMYEGVDEAIRTIAEIPQLTNQLAEIVEKAYREINNLSGICHVALRNNNKWGFVAAYPKATLNDFQALIGEVALEGVYPKGVVGRVLLDGKIANVSDTTVDRDYLAYRHMNSQLSVPIYGRTGNIESEANEVIGVLSVEHPDKYGFNPIHEARLTSLAQEVAETIWNLKGKPTHEEPVHLGLLTTADPDYVVREILNKACEKLNAWFGVVIFEDNLGGLGKPIVSQQFRKSFEGIRSDGNSMKIYEEKVDAFYISDTANTKYELNAGIYNDGIKAVVGLPIIYKNKRGGVMWLHFKEIQVFSASSKKLFDLLAKQLANAYFRAIVERAREQIRIAIGVISQATDVTDILQRIVEHAVRIGQGTDASLLLYDSTLKKFDFEHVIQYRNPSDAASLYRDDERAGTTSNKVIEQGEFEVTNIEQNPDIRPLMYDRLKACGVDAFYGIPISVKGECYGVLYVDFNIPYKMSGEAKQRLKEFASFAGIAWRNAQLLHKTQEIAELSIRGNAREALEKLIEQVRFSIGCDITAIYVFDSKQNRFVDRVINASANLHHFKLPEQLTNRSATIWRVLMGDEDYRILDSGHSNVMLASSSFVQDAGVKATLAVPLRSDNACYGVMFFSFQSTHIFSGDEIEKAKNFSSQAFTLIQQFTEREQTKQKLKANQALAWMGASNNIWRHQIEGDAVTIAYGVDLIEQKLRLQDNQALATIQNQLLEIRSLSKNITTRQVVPPLSIDQGREIFSVTSLVRERLSKLEKRGQEKKLSFMVDDSLFEEYFVNASGIWVQIAFDIVLKNAFEAINELEIDRHSIIIKARLEDKKIKICVIDRGDGIPNTVKEKLFNAQISTKQNKGLGMGLLLAQQIIELYGGFIYYEDNKPQGTIMLMCLPQIQIGGGV